MGIKLCPKCGKKVSDSRNDCIHCGYVFPSVTKCPDCESEVPPDAAECPECGHVFKKAEEPKREPTQTAEPTKEKDQHPTCPYCGESELMEIGHGSYVCLTCKGKFLDAAGSGAPVVFSPPIAAKPQSANANKVDSMDEAEVVPETPSRFNGRVLVIVLSIITLVLAIASMILLAVSPLGIERGTGSSWSRSYIYLFNSRYSSTFLSLIFGSVAVIASIINMIFLIVTRKSDRAVGGVVANIFVVVSAIISSAAFYFIKLESEGRTGKEFDSTISGPLVPLLMLLVLVLSVATLSFLRNKAKKKQPFVYGVCGSINVAFQVISASFVSGCFSLVTFSVIAYNHSSPVFLWDGGRQMFYVILAFAVITIGLVLSLISLRMLASHSKGSGVFTIIANLLSCGGALGMSYFIKNCMNRYEDPSYAYLSLGSKIVVYLGFVAAGLAFLSFVWRIVLMGIDAEREY